MHVSQNFALTLHSQKRDVAQLVAYYVRDVGVGRSNRLIPTDFGESHNNQRFNPCRGLSGRRFFGGHFIFFKMFNHRAFQTKLRNA